MMKHVFSPRVSALAAALIVLFAQAAMAASRRYSSSTKSSDPPWDLIIGAVVLFVVLMGMVFYFDRRRRKKLGEMAQSLGLTYRAVATDADCRMPAGCSLMDEGRDPAIGNVLEVARTDELDFTLFDLSYTSGYGRSETVISQTVGRMRAPLLKLPEFRLFPQTILSDIRIAFGGTDINFSDSPNFSKKYVLRGEDEAAICRLFTPSLRQTLETFDHLTVEGANDVLFVFRWGRRIKPADLAARIEDDKRILAGFVEAQQPNAKQS
jgi:hypothetical protein